ncbi:extracellular mutant protein 11-domain-containing protein [Xylariaceae sp. FL0016]|nr:extracellular mutant protein 11-domain-containing protein [Xylariaceae sp. FL0016]
MPPSTFFKNKMQAWVTNNGHSSSQPLPAAYDGHDNAQRRHVHLARSTAPATQPTSPPRSRAPIVNANSNRAPSSMGARIPVPSGRPGHVRDLSLDGAKSRTISSEPVQQATKRGPFWDGSTIDGSVFSDTASNVDASTGYASHNRRRQIPAPSSYQHPQHQQYHQREQPRHRPSQKVTNGADQHPPFIIGENGMIDVVGANVLTRSASTPDARSQRRDFKETAGEPGYDQYADDALYQTSPEKTPPAKRLHHAKPLAVRGARRDSFTERTNILTNVKVNMTKSPQKEPAYESPDEALDEVQSLQQPPADHLRLKVPEAQPHRSTIFADTDTPMVSHPDESEGESVEEPTPRQPVKAQPHVVRNLFPKNGKGNNGLIESAMPRPQADKRHSTAKPAKTVKKRQYELDYDDGALNAMNYQRLRTEAFDFDPAQAEAQAIPEPLRGTLPEKLDHFFNKDQRIQMDFFTKLPVKDWEDSGDWFLERFGEVMEKFKTARKAKRALVEEFENEIAERESAVRNKMQGIDQTLCELKAEGEGMMSNKEFE